MLRKEKTEKSNNECWIVRTKIEKKKRKKENINKKR